MDRDDVMALLHDPAYHILDLAIGNAARALYWAAGENLKELLTYGQMDAAIRLARNWEHAEEQAMELRYEAAWARWAILTARAKGKNS
jgi:uncharacterized membrane-anchored protein